MMGITNHSPMGTLMEYAKARLGTCRVRLCRAALPALSACRTMADLQKGRRQIAHRGWASGTRMGRRGVWVMESGAALSGEACKRVIEAPGARPSGA